MRSRIILCLLFGIFPGCVSTADRTAGANSAALKGDQLSDKAFVFETLRYIYRWHFDQSYFLDEDKQDALEIWSKRIHPKLDKDDRSDYAEIWIPAIKTEALLKRSEYAVPELNLNINEAGFKITRVNRQRGPSAPRSSFHIARYPLGEVKDYL